MFLLCGGHFLKGKLWLGEGVWYIMWECVAYYMHIAKVSLFSAGVDEK